MSVTYSRVGGRLVREVRNSVITRYVSDTLGSIVQTRNSAGTQTSSTEFWPFGEVRTSSGSNPSPWGFVGALGYYVDLASRLYVRARYYRTSLSRWMTVDPLWPKEFAYLYVEGAVPYVIDPSGKQSYQDTFNKWGKDFTKGIEDRWTEFCRSLNDCNGCATSLLLNWGINNRTHDCHHGFTHCMTCCVLASRFGKDCAIKKQNSQNFWQGWKGESVKSERMKQCKTGLGDRKGKSCDEYCRKQHGGKNNKPGCKDQPYPGTLANPFSCT